MNHDRFLIVTLILLLSACSVRSEAFHYEGLWGYRVVRAGVREVDEFVSIARLKSGLYLVIVTSFSDTLSSVKAAAELNRNGHLTVRLWDSDWVIEGRTKNGQDVLLMYSDSDSEAIVGFWRVEDIPAGELALHSE